MFTQFYRIQMRDIYTVHNIGHNHTNNGHHNRHHINHTDYYSCKHNSFYPGFYSRANRLDQTDIWTICAVCGDFLVNICTQMQFYSGSQKRRRLHCSFQSSILNRQHLSADNRVQRDGVHWRDHPDKHTLVRHRH